RSTSSCVSQLTWNENASVNANSGPPFRAVTTCPSSSNSTVITLPGSPGPASPQRLTWRIFEFENTDVYSSAASSACESNQRKGVIFGIAFVLSRLGWSLDLARDEKSSAGAYETPVDAAPRLNKANRHQTGGIRWGRSW